MENIEAFWARVKRGATSECWLWDGARNSRGYGYLTFAGVGYTAHALAFRLSHAALGNGSLRVGQDCGNKLCCNPAHLNARFRPSVGGAIRTADARKRGA
jgi:hypothetical protein